MDNGDLELILVKQFYEIYAEGLPPKRAPAVATQEDVEHTFQLHSRQRGGRGPLETQGAKVARILLLQSRLQACSTWWSAGRGGLKTCVWEVVPTYRRRMSPM